ncbi:diguanylate cyclase [Motiliproteus sediminis]|uniref:diguanylate cyclase n=1 Tax=Motiliproteus sediminis TaxID=1468178 RepID=UPI001AEF8E9D|nr:diguanylate cyclase [Motiliproteus sediminis]
MEDFSGPVQIADRVWWVGQKQKDDVFQSHVYLLEQGDQSVLFDPGSLLTFDDTLAKIEQVIPFDQIRYFVCHHQDPDITAALPRIDGMITRDDAVVVSHWRAKALIQHYDLKRLPFWLIEEHDWELQLPDRKLLFRFTPYAHFPGAFVSFDDASGVLFSSDLFGGFTHSFSLYAKDESYFEEIRYFHEHYMPSRDVLEFALSQFESLPLKLVAPQHGSIIPEHLIGFIFDQVRTLDCGIYLLAKKDTDLRRLMALNQTLRDLTRSMVMHRDFREIATSLTEILRRHLPVKAVEFYSRLDSGVIIHLTPERMYHGVLADPPVSVRERLGVVKPEAPLPLQLKRSEDGEGTPDWCWMLPLYPGQRREASAVALLRFADNFEQTEGIERIIATAISYLEVAVERENIYWELDLERKRLFERSIRDPLTGLYNRLHMLNALQPLLNIHDRDPNSGLSVAIIDIDHFKQINDTYGHAQGDEVLRRLARLLLDDTREADLAVRLGGEEFAVFFVGNTANGVATYAERIREHIGEMRFQRLTQQVTVSIGTAIRRQQEPLESLLYRADMALYKAKREGRDRVEQSQV